MPQSGWAQEEKWIEQGRSGESDTRAEEYITVGVGVSGKTRVVVQAQIEGSGKERDILPGRSIGGLFRGGRI